MAAPTKSKRPKARDPQKAQAFLDAQAVKRGNAAANRRANEAAMDEEAKKPVPRKRYGGSMGKKPTTKMAKGTSCRGMGKASRGGRYSRSA
jgi:hypothetical protein